MKIDNVILLIGLIFLTQSCVIVKSNMYDRVENWEQYQFEKVRNYQEFVDIIKKQNEFNVIGTVSYEDSNYDIYEIKINNNADKDILIFGGVHGDEIAGITSSIDFINNYNKNNYSKNYNYIIVPIVNPWGFEFNCRYNGIGIDINRDFAVNKFDSQEANIIYDRYKDTSPYIVIDNHEDNWLSDNYFFVYDKNVKNSITEFVESDHGYRLNNDMKYFIYKTKNGINYIGKSILWLVEMSDRLTLSNYFLKHTDNVIVIESGTANVSLDIRNRFHLDSMDYILNTL